MALETLQRRVRFDGPAVLPRSVAGLTARRLDRLPPALAGAAVIGAIAASIVTLSAPDQEIGRVVSNLAPAAIDLLVVALALTAAVRSASGRVRAGWAAIAAATLVYAVGDILFAWYELVLGVEAFPSPADIAYVAYYPILVLALLVLPSGRAEARERIRTAVDSAIVVLGGGMVILETVLRPALESLDPDPLRTTLALGYPVGDLILLAAVAPLAMRRPAGMSAGALVGLVAGIVLVLLADIAFALAAGEPSGRWQPAADVLYLASSAGLGIGAWQQTRVPGPAEPDHGEGELPRPLLYLPYAALAGGYATVVATIDLGRAGSAQVLVGALILTLLVLARQELVLRDLSRVRADHARRESDARFRSLARQASDAITLVDPAGLVRDATDSAARVLGLEARMLIGRPLVGLAHVDDAARLASLIDDTAANRPTVDRVEWRLWDGNGVWRQVETVAVSLLDDPSVNALVLTTRDVRDRKALEEQLRQVALHDPLTGLANRSLFLDRVAQATADAAGADACIVLVVNLDGFRRVNAGLGHATGDRVLQEVGARIATALRPADTCARIGGDEYGVLLRMTGGAAAATAVARRILATLEEPIVAGSARIRLGARIGIASPRADATTASTIVRNATVAAAQGRHDGRDGIAVFEPHMQEVIEGSLTLEAELRDAVARNQLVLQYQPIVDLQSGVLVAAEALVRWDHPSRGRLGPGAFIPIAEETGLIDEIGTWVLRSACEEVATWARIARSAVPRVCVNLSARQLADPNLPWAVQAAVTNAGAVPGWVSLEVTESLLMEHTSSILERLHALRALGMSIAIDDFGTGYSSLAYLQHFPMSHLKIDRSFIAPLDDPDREAGIVRAIVEIGRALGMSTVAEGIETELEHARLRDLGCTLGQGFLFDRPLDADVLRARVAGRQESARGPRRRRR